MTLGEIDAALADWEKKLDAAMLNVSELTEKKIYKKLAGTGGYNKRPLAGDTEKKVEAALKAMGKIWDGLFVKLEPVLKQAKNLRQSLPAQYTADQLLAIQQLLVGASVKDVITMNFTDRGLLDAKSTAQAFTPAQVLEAMVKGYEDAKSVILEVESQETRLRGAVQTSRDEAEALSQRAQALGFGGVPELTGLLDKLSDLSLRIMSDPLGVRDDFACGIEPALKQARERIDKLERELKALRQDLDSAQTSAATLVDTHEKAKATFAARKEKTSADNDQALPQPLDETIIESLVQWYDRLVATTNSGKLQAARIGLTNWNTQCSARQAYCNTVLKENKAPLDKREELRGLLSALSAKASNMGMSEDKVLFELYKKANDLLYTRPTPLAEAELRVNEYKAALG
jgi:hypothetical protein